MIEASLCLLTYRPATDNDRVNKGARISAVMLVIFMDSCMIRTQSPPKPDPIPVELRVDINHASIEQLMKVPGMKRSWAGRIVRFRPYREKTDLVDLGIVDGDFYYSVKDYLIAHRDPR